MHVDDSYNTNTLIQNVSKDDSGSHIQKIQNCLLGSVLSFFVKHFVFSVHQPIVIMLGYNHHDEERKENTIPSTKKIVNKSVFARPVYAFAIAVYMFFIEIYQII